jgi:ketosteroid isomerase-like protein
MAASSFREENLALVRAAIDAYNRGDIEYILETLDPEIEVYAEPGLVNAGTYRGIDGFKTWVTEWTDAWESFRNDIHRIETIGDHHVLAEVDQFARGAGSGVEVEMRLVYMFEEHDGRASRLHLYRDWDAAAEVVERLRREAEAGA